MLYEICGFGDFWWSEEGKIRKRMKIDEHFKIQTIYFKWKYSLGSFIMRNKNLKDKVSLVPENNSISLLINFAAMLSSFEVLN